MAAPTSAPAGSSVPPSKGVIPAEWPAQAADTIVDTVAKVRDKTTKPAITAARAAVYGLIAGVVGLVAFVLVLIVVVRVWANYVPGHVWIIYAILGVLLSIGGIVLLGRANRPAPSASPTD